MVIHKLVSEAAPNWAVESVTAPEQVFGSGNGVELTGVRATIAGFSTPEAERTVSLAVNGKIVSSQRAHIPGNGRLAVIFPGVTVPHGFSRCEVQIDAADSLTQDDTYRFAVERSDSLPVLFIHSAADARAPTYFGNALTAAEGPAFALQSASLEQAARLSLNRYAFVVVSGIAALPPLLENELRQYVQAGGNVWMVLGPGARQGPVPIFGDSVLEGRDYGAAAIAGRRFESVGTGAVSPNWLGDSPMWSGIKFFYAAQVEEADSAVLLRLTDHTPLLLEKDQGEGRVLLMTSGFEGLSNDLPLHPAFVAFVAQAARHLSNRNRGDAQRSVDSFLDLHSGELRNAPATGVEVIDPQGHRPCP